MTPLRLADLPEGEPDALAGHDLDAGCAWCGAVTRDLEPDAEDPGALACAGCRALVEPAVTVAGVTIPARELARAEASVPARARAVLDLVRHRGLDAWDVAREGREMDRAVSRLVRGDAADALESLAAALRAMPPTPRGDRLEALARAVVATERRLGAALAWEQQRAAVRSKQRERT